MSLIRPPDPPEAIVAAASFNPRRVSGSGCLEGLSMLLSHFRAMWSVTIKVVPFQIWPELSGRPDDRQAFLLRCSARVADFSFALFGVLGQYCSDAVVAGPIDVRISIELKTPSDENTQAYSPHT